MSTDRNDRPDVEKENPMSTYTVAAPSAGLAQAAHTAALVQAVSARREARERGIPEPATPETFTELMLLLTSIGALLPEQAQVLIDAITTGEGIDALPMISGPTTSPDTVSLYDVLRTLVQHHVDPTLESWLGDLLDDALGVIDAVVEHVAHWAEELGPYAAVALVLLA